ncbi:hypothetical protein, partial [Streptomyces sp. NPDC002215]|uniref:hypothetical protein n=1 Tax=Streptomyces sp. NPDC002215 TaxID=3154412 RepID=UPI00331F7B1A
DVPGVANNLIGFSGELNVAALQAESTAAAQAAVDVLRESTPPTQMLLTHRWMLSQALHTLTRRFIVDGSADQARAAARETIQAYRDVAGTVDADVPGVANNLIGFSGELNVAALQAESTAAAQAAHDLKA